MPGWEKSGAVHPDVYGPDCYLAAPDCSDEGRGCHPSGDLFGDLSQPSEKRASIQPEN